MSLDIEKAIMFQRQLENEILTIIKTEVLSYDSYSRKLDKLDIVLLKLTAKIFANSKDDLERYIETSKDMQTPDINLLQVIGDTFYKIEEHEYLYKISISIEGIRTYINEMIGYVAKLESIKLPSSFGDNEERFTREVFKRYINKKFFKDINDRGKISVEFEIYEILTFLDIQDKNTSYEKFSNLKKFKIDKMMPGIQKALGLEIEVYTVNSGRNTERIYLECVDKIQPKSYARQLKEMYHMGVANLENVMKDLDAIIDGKKDLVFKSLAEGEYLLELGGIEFKFIVGKTLNYKVDLNIQYSIKNKNHELIVNESILKEDIMYTRYGQRCFEYIAFIIANCIDDIYTCSCGIILNKEININLGEINYIDLISKSGPITNRNGNTHYCEIVKMNPDIEEVNIRGEHLLKVRVNLNPLLRVDISKMINNLPDNADEYLKHYDLQCYDTDTALKEGTPYIENLMFTMNLEKEEFYIKIPNIKFIGLMDKEIKKEVPWDSKKILEEDNILSMKDTEKEFLGACIERFIHNNLAAMCDSGEILKYVSKESAEKIKNYYQENEYIGAEYIEEELINYLDLIL